MKAAILAILFFTTTLTPARAASREVRAVLVTGIYGAAFGTGLGLITYPLTSNLRTIFIGTSVGLYLGLIVGGYLVTHPEEPGNPYRASHPGGNPSLGLIEEKGHQTSVALLAAASPTKMIEVSWPLVEF